MEELVKKGEINETINKLYALRAGLSLVDKEYDKAKEIENTNKNKNYLKSVETIKSLYDDNYIKRQRIECIKKETANKNYNLKSEYERKSKAYEDLIKKRESNKKDTMRTMITFIIVLAVTVLVWIFAAILAFVAIVLDYELSLIDVMTSDLFVAIMFFVGVAFVVMPFVSLGMWGMWSVAASEYKKTKKELQNTSKPKQHAVLLYENNEELIVAEQTIKENIEKTKKIKEEADKRTEESNRTVNAISKNAIEMYNTLTREFKDILPNLDIRDYRNVDLIIYLLETGRAETMKEALQQVDTYIHTDRIVKAISDASKTISQSIRLNSMAIQQTIKETTFELGNKLDRITYNVNAMSDRQSALMKELNESVSRTNSVVEMQNALLEKANVSSAEMAENIDRMRYYADQEYIRNANKW